MSIFVTDTAPLPYEYFTHASPLDKPENLDDIHEVALMIHRVWLLWKKSVARHASDVTAIGNSLRDIAEDREMCEDFERAMDTVARSGVFHAETFRKAVKRTHLYTVTLTVEVEALNEDSAEDDVLSTYGVSRYSSAVQSVSAELAEE